MDKDVIDKIMCNRVVFVQAISMYLNNQTELSETLINALKIFAVDNADVFYRELYMIMFFHLDKNYNLEFIEPDNIGELCEKYSKKLHDPKKLCEVYDKVGYDDTERLTEFAGVFLNYIFSFKNDNKYKQ